MSVHASRVGPIITRAQGERPRCCPARLPERPCCSRLWHRLRQDDGCTVYEGSRGRRRQSLAYGVRLAGSRGGVLGLVVLAAAAMARFPRRNGGRGTLAMAGGGSVRAGVRCRATLHLGLRV